MHVTKLVFRCLSARPADFYSPFESPLSVSFLDSGGNVESLTRSLSQASSLDETHLLFWNHKHRSRKSRFVGNPGGFGSWAGVRPTCLFSESPWPSSWLFTPVMSIQGRQCQLFLSPGPRGRPIDSSFSLCSASPFSLKKNYKISHEQKKLQKKKKKKPTHNSLPPHICKTNKKIYKTQLTHISLEASLGKAALHYRFESLKRTVRRASVQGSIGRSIQEEFRDKSSFPKAPCELSTRRDPQYDITDQRSIRRFWPVEPA